MDDQKVPERPVPGGNEPGGNEPARATGTPGWRPLLARHRRFVVAALVTIAVLAATAIGLAARDGDRARPAAPLADPTVNIVDGPPVLAPFRVAGEDLWSGANGGPFPSVKTVEMRGDAMLLVSSDIGNHPRLSVVDPATGRTRWTLGNDKLPGGGEARWAYWRDKPRIVGAGENWAVLILYHVDGE